MRAAPNTRCPRCARGRCDCPVGVGPIGRPYSALHVAIAAEELAALSPSEACVLGAVARRSSGCRGACWAAVETLAAAAHVSERTAQRALQRLVELGVLQATAGVGVSTEYTIPAVVVADLLAGDGPGVDLEADEPAEVPRETEQAGGGCHGDGGVTVTGVSPCRGGGVRLTPDQITDPITLPPPCSPTPPAAGGDRWAEHAVQDQVARKRWASDRALADLASSSSPAAVVGRYERGEATLVAVWRRYVATGVWPDAPDGLRSREIRHGLRDAAARWRRGERPVSPPPATGQLELPDEAWPDVVTHLARAPSPAPVAAPPAPATGSGGLVGLAALHEARRRREARQ